MARGRMLSKTLGTSRKFAATGTQAGEFPQLLFSLIIPHTDDFGRMPGDAFTVKNRVFPTSPRSEQEFDAALVALERTQLIVRYDVRGAQVIQIVKFEEHQQGLHKRTKSEFPAPPPSIPGGSGKVQEIPSELNLSESNSPLPPAVAGGVRVLREHRQKAEAVHKAWMGYCKHDRKCESPSACKKLIALNFALQAVAS